MSSEFKQLIKEAICILGSEGGSDNILLALRLQHEFDKHNKNNKKVK